MARALERDGPRDQLLLRAAAFLGRHGRQPIDVVLRMPVTDIMFLVKVVQEMVEAELPDGPLTGM